MAEADLDAIIRQLAKQQTKALTAAVKKRRAALLARGAKAKDATGKAQAKALATVAYELGLAAAKRLQMAADNAADSYARAMRKAAEEAAAAAKPKQKQKDEPADDAAKTGAANPGARRKAAKHDKAPAAKTPAKPAAKPKPKPARKAKA